MKGDFSRYTFDPTKGFTQVLRQQGRVDVDADWNEQQAIHSYLDRTTRGDLIGPAGAPIENAGFSIELDDGALRIGAGHFYVQGQFVELGQATLLADQPYLAGVYPFHDTDGTPIEDPVSGRYVFFLETWDYHITAVEDPSLKEPALGASGPDTTTRLKTAWRVRALRLGDTSSDVHCETSTPAWTSLITPPDGTLAARARAEPAATNLCVLPETAGYQSLDHRHYYVEVHDAGSDGTATWKWSRDNAAFVARWLARNGNELTVSTTGFDAHIGFRNGGTIELTSDTLELAGLPGTLVRVDLVAGDVLHVDAATATGSLDLTTFGDNPKIRAWDSAGALSLTSGAFLALENGVEVEFGAGTYNTGDYWMIPARSGIGVLWPQTGGVPQTRKRFGTEHHFARLAVMDFSGEDWSPVADCRPLFPWANALMTLDVLSGDAQHVLPDPANAAALLQLPQPLQVGVARGAYPVPNARVRFRVIAGNGQLTGGASEFVMFTDSNGHAQVDFLLDSTTLVQTVEAQLQSPGADPRHLTHQFSARLSRASEVSFDPANCPPLAGDRTVQAAIERLCQNHASGCATYVLSPESDWRAVLLGLTPGEHAHICFRRGIYRTDTRIELRNLGHIVLSGAGAGSRILTEGPECALLFANCASLKVSDLAFAAPKASDPQSPIADINGVLTAQACGEVTVQGVHILTGASDRNDRACLTVREVQGGAATTVTPRVQISDSEFLVGNGQTGVLITDAGIVNISHNRVTGQGEVPPATDSDGNNIINPALLDGILNRLVSNMVADTGRPQGRPEKGVQVSAGMFTAYIDSTIDERDWRMAVAKNPPVEAELKDNEAFAVYLGRVADDIAANPSHAPSYERIRNAVKLASLEPELKPEAARRIILGEQPIEVSVASPGNTGRRISLSVREHRVSFNSELNQAQWNQLIGAVPTKTVNSPSVLSQVVRETARRLAIDPTFRARFDFAEKLIGNLVARTAGVAAKGIICGGRRLDEVSISGNSFERVHEGIRVAVSHSAEASAPPDFSRAVAICDNHITLSLPGAATRGNQGILIGNAQRVLVSGNELRYSRLGDDPLFAVGIELWGHYGSQIHLRENTVERAESAIRVTFENDIGVTKEVIALWRAIGNLSVGGGEAPFVFRTDPGSSGSAQTVNFIQRDNMAVEE